MKKLIIVGIGAFLLLSLAVVSSCTEEDDGYTSCSNTCSASEPYSNQSTNSCYATLSECETATGQDCKNCN